MSATTARLEAFSDGVLAIAITLLVLEIRVPNVPKGSTLAHELLHLWPKYAVFTVSFVTIGIMWINHHALFEHVGRIDRRLSFVNLGLLMTISFVPFPTAVLGEYVSTSTNGHVAAALYGINMVLVGLGFLGLWSYLYAHPELRVSTTTDSQIRVALRRTVVGPICYLVAIVIALLSGPGALAIYAAVALYFATSQLTRAPI